MRITREGPGKLLTLVGYSSVLPNITESRRPLIVSTPTHPPPVTPEEGIQITRRSTNTVVVVYHRLEPFTKVQI